MFWDFAGLFFMKTLRDRGPRLRRKATPRVGVSVRKEPLVWASRCFLALLLLSVPFAVQTAAVWAQNTGRSAESPLMGQLRQALRLDEHGDRQGAMALTLRLLSENPKFAPAIKLKGMLLEEAGQASEAETAYEEALKLAPNDPDLLFKTGVYQLAAGDRAQAIKLLEHSTKILPGDGEAQFYLAQAYHLNGQDKLALAAIRASLKAEPDNPPVWQKYGELLCSTGDCEAGLRWLMKAHDSKAGLPMIDYDIAWTDFKLMDVAGAAPYAARAVQTRPNDLNALQLLATVNVKLARWAEAQTAFERIVAVKADDVEALLGLGHCQVELKNYQTAVQTLQAVLRIDPTHLLAHFYLSRAYAGLGRTAEAEHESALHQFMMERLTFARAEENEESESPIRSNAYELLTRHREDEALQLYREHFKGSQATTADAYVFVGKLYLMGGDEEDGLRCLQHALKVQPTVRGAHTFEGILALKKGDLSGAEIEFTAELANDPNSQMAIAEMGEVRYHQQQWSEAAEQLAKSKTATPELLYMLSDSYFHLGKVDEAKLAAEAAVAYGRNKPEFTKEVNELLVRNRQTELAQRLSAGADLGGQPLPGQLLSAKPGAPAGISLTTKTRVHDEPGWWPTKGSASKDQFVGNAACAKCHAAKAASFNGAAMSHAAVPVEDSEIVRKRGSLQFQAGPYQYEPQSSGGKAALKVSDAKASVSVPLNWAFGAGHMGQTYVYEKNGNYFESHVTFFALPQALDITPGQSSATPANLESAPGRQMGMEETQLCFGCHTTGSTTQGRFDPTDLVPGVTCESCHGPGRDHMAAASLGSTEPGESDIFNPARLDRVDSVDFCGACHRTSKDIETGGKLGIFNVRFAPYRLEKSECWKQGDKRITCLACHDPHKPLEHEAGSYDSACLQCHSAAAEKPAAAVHSPTVCSVATKNCVTCHMPKYEPPRMHTSFTDHWIRVVRAGEPYPE